VVAAARTVITKPFESHVEAVNCHHNYVQPETHFGKDVLVTRKGAVSAKAGELGIIPGSMGARASSCVARATRRASQLQPRRRSRDEPYRRRRSCFTWPTTARRPKAWSAARMPT
jgi:hypothetical protein